MVPEAVLAWGVSSWAKNKSVPLAVHRPQRSSWGPREEEADVRPGVLLRAEVSGFRGDQGGQGNRTLTPKTTPVLDPALLTPAIFSLTQRPWPGCLLCPLTYTNGREILSLENTKKWNLLAAQVKTRWSRLREEVRKSVSFKRNRQASQFWKLLRSPCA